MGDLKKNDPQIPSFPPGIRFYPTEQQLLSFYLFNKNKKSNPNNISLPSSSSKNPLFDFDLIRDIDLYNYDPCDLPEIYSFSFGRGGRKKHWYYFTVKEVMGSENMKRKVKGGFWKFKGRSRNIMGETSEGEAVLGTKRNFVFFRGSSSGSSNRTNWLMIEYALVDNRKESFVVCRVFLKSDRKKRVNHVPHSFAEETIATVQNTFINDPRKQLDAPSISGFGEVVAHEEILVNEENEIKEFPLKLSGDPDDAVITQQVSHGCFGSSMGIPQSDQLVKSSDGFISGGAISYDANVTVDDLLTNSIILDGDFIELDDLLGPLSPLVGIDSSG